jgi:acyl dehydratase
MDVSAAGKSFTPYEFHVERGKIREFADALGDPNPVYRDPNSAAAKAAGGLLAPPTMLRCFLYETRDAVEALKVADWSYIVHGEQEFEYLAPVRAGDVLSARDRIVSITEKESRRAGKLQIAVIETTFHNQRGEKVQVARRTLVETGKRISDA